MMPFKVAPMGAEYVDKITRAMSTDLTIEEPPKFEQSKNHKVSSSASRLLPRVL